MQSLLHPVSLFLALPYLPVYTLQKVDSKGSTTTTSELLGKNGGGGESKHSCMHQLNSPKKPRAR